MKHLLCRLFGHRMPTGYAGGSPYMTVWGRAIDGCGTEHLFMSAKCARCASPIRANVHVPRRRRQEEAGRDA